MHIKHTLSGILINAALSADTKSEKLERLLHLYYEGYDVLDVYYEVLSNE
jgi:hypothetical protein